MIFSYLRGQGQDASHPPAPTRHEEELNGLAIGHYFNIAMRLGPPPHLKSAKQVAG